MTSGAAPRRHRGLFWSAVLVGVALLVVGGVTAWTGWRTNAGPEGAIRGYFGALRDGDAGRALSFGDVPDGQRTLLTAPVLALQQRTAPIRDVTILSISRTGDSATASVRYTLAYPGAPQVNVDTVRLRRGDGDWRLAQTAVPVTLHLLQAADRATVDGAAVPKGRVLVFPGAAPIGFDTPNLQLDPQQSRVSLGSHGVVDVGVQVSDKGRAALASAVTAVLKGCLAHPSAASACPLPSSAAVPGTLVATLTGDVGESLQATVGSSPAGLITLGGTVTIDGTYRSLDFENKPHVKKGEATLPLAGTAYATDPGSVLWAVP